MNIRCFFDYQSMPIDVAAQNTIIVLDVLRATTSMITALHNGAKEIIPVKEIKNALKLKERHPQAILSGERNGIIIDGFQLGNSPAEFSPQVVAGRSVIACTTNGTSAIWAAKESQEVWIAAFLNRVAVAKKILDNNKEEFILLCSGTSGEPSLDDILGAGAILDLLNTAPDPPRLNDSAKIALDLFDYYRSDLIKGILSSKHGQKLYRLGLKEDIQYAAQLDILDIVPVLKDHKIIIE